MRKVVSRTLLAYCVIGSLLTGCSTTGPNAIRSGRLTYNEAIAETNNQQMLMVMIHNRYAEQANLLAVASVTANVRVTTGAAIELGAGDSANYAGNLVPFSASAVYEENPTISYTPVGGQQYLHQIASPIPLSILAQLTATLADATPVYTALVSSVNGLINPDFLFAEVKTDPRFNRLVSIMTKLTRTHRLHWIENSKETGNFSIVIDNYAAAHKAEVTELLRLLGLPTPKDHSQAIVLPVSLALNSHDSGGIGITTRSVLRLIEIMSAAIELPPQDKANGSTTDYPPLGAAGSGLRIRYAKAKPDRAAVAVQHGEGWFYIDDQDRVTKQYFRLLSLLWSVTIAESTIKSPASPVLTVPVSR